MKCQTKQKDGSTLCGKELVFKPHPTKSEGTLGCPEHTDNSQRVITCHSCFRNHTQVSDDIGLWVPNNSCNCVCHGGSK